MKIFGISIDTFTREEIIERIKVFLDEPKFHQIATINPEFLLEAEKNGDFHKVLEHCDLHVADGFGIVLASLLHGIHIARFAGADLMEEVLSLANERRLGVYLALRKDGLSSFQEIKEALLKKYPEIQVEGDSIDSQNIGSWKPARLTGGLETGNCTIALCNFGAPSQELFLSRLKTDSYLLRLAMGVGGSFDYLTGKLKRAPIWMQKTGLEWLWRLILEPRYRWKRIWNAVIVFPFRVFFATITTK
jgi:N-acetylglucosaminyldiphosphoundecaprenol N-acetyl-beta-D-mannosaminyltransferase